MTLRGKPFRRGHDPRRHELTPTERQLGGIEGYKAAKLICDQDAGKAGWFFRHIRGIYRRRRHERGEADGCPTEA